MIEFLCPNGHRIHCPDDQAGRAAKCPKCGVKFRIPDTSEVDDDNPRTGNMDVSLPHFSDSAEVSPPAKPAAPAAPAAKEPQIEFLCPNGHRLHGPASLQGRPGQCPECGSKFRIPSYDDVAEDEEMGQDIGVGRANGTTGSGVALPPPTADEVPEAEPIEELRELEEIPIATPADGSPGGEAPHPMAVLFDRFWAKKSESNRVELHLVGGETLVPDRFAEALSRKSHGVFSVAEPDGSHTLTAVTWDSVIRVVVRGLEKLPPEMAP